MLYKFQAIPVQAILSFSMRGVKKGNKAGLVRTICVADPFRNLPTEIRSEELETAQLVKCSLYKQESPSLIPRTYIKPGCDGYGDVETGRPLGLSSQPVEPAEELQASGRPISKRKWSGPEERHIRLTPGLHMHTQM